MPSWQEKINSFQREVYMAVNVRYIVNDVDAAIFYAFWMLSGYWQFLPETLEYSRTPKKQTRWKLGAQSHGPKTRTKGVRVLWLPDYQHRVKPVKAGGAKLWVFAVSGDRQGEDCQTATERVNPVKAGGAKLWAYAFREKRMAARLPKGAEIN
jgi:hypothetical protein